MIFQQDVKCRICLKTFCCVKCRIKHEENTHPNEIKEEQSSKQPFNEYCPICSQKPFLQTVKIPEALLKHICDEHLPLHCKKCLKVYKNEKEILDFSKCKKENQICNLENRMSVLNSDLSPKSSEKENQDSKTSLTVSTQTSPNFQNSASNETDSNIRTPILMHNLRWTAKVKESITDASILKNVSSIHNSGALRTTTDINKINGSAKKLVRSTSTPVQLLIPIKQGTFDSSSCQVSSIHASSSESDVSPPPQSLLTPSPGNRLFPKPIGKNKQIGGRGRPKMAISATPLRQVMSKSIQRAMADHGIVNSGVLFTGVQPKKIFDSTNKSGHSSMNSSPLDLRTSPALRRTKSEIVENHKNYQHSTFEEFLTSKTSTRNNVLCCSRKLSIQEDIFITASESISTTTESLNTENFNTIYETCRCIETSSVCHINELKEIDKNVDEKFSSSPKTPDKMSQNDDEQNFDEVFYTPKSIPNENQLNINEMNKNDRIKENVNKENVLINRIDSEKSPKKAGKLWSLVSSVIRLASFGCENDNKQIKNNDTKSPLITRCASYAGVSTRQQSSVDDDDDDNIPSLKRKRTTTVDNWSSRLTSPKKDFNYLNAAPKRIKRIQGRRPIDRMRNLQ